MDTQMTRGRRLPPSGSFVPTTSDQTVSLPYALTGLAIVSIWVSVVLAMIFSPDMVSGSQHEHLASGWGDWIWGAVATGFVVTTALEGFRAKATNQAAWLGLGFGVTAIWIGVVLVSVFSPRFVTGTDPTLLPFGAWLSPIAGLILTWFVCTFAKSIFAFQEPLAEAVPAGNVDTVVKLRQLTNLRDAGTITSAEFETKKTELLARF
jgi:putative oligomerization/nucleic acid binding protein